jgi:hypothetical protein
LERQRTARGHETTGPRVHLDPVSAEEIGGHISLEDEIDEDAAS